MAIHRISRRRLVASAGTLVGAAMFPIPLIAGQKDDVIVIGAGLSGLHSASLLEQTGLKVTVLEGSNNYGESLDDTSILFLHRVQASMREYLKTPGGTKSVDKFDRLPIDKVEALTLKELAKILPESQGAVRVGKTVSWQKSKLNGGCYAVWEPGQVSRYANLMAKPAGNLHFAGEHTSRWLSG